MCLTKVISAKEKIKKDGLYYIGYKVVELSETGKTFSTFYNKNRPFLKWLNRAKKATGYIIADDSKLYKLGFHIWTNKKAAEEWKDHPDEVICQVLFTKIIAEGIENIGNKEYRCVVTDQMYVLPPIGY